MSRYLFFSSQKFSSATQPTSKVIGRMGRGGRHGGNMDCPGQVRRQATLPSQFSGPKVETNFPLSRLHDGVSLPCKPFLDITYVPHPSARSWQENSGVPTRTIRVQKGDQQKQRKKSTCSFGSMPNPDIHGRNSIRVF